MILQSLNHKSHVLLCKILRRGLALIFISIQMSVLQTRIEPLPDYIKRPEAENTSQQQESIEQTDKPDQPEEPK